MRYTTPLQLKKIHTLLGGMGIKDKDDKKKIISSFTGGRVESSKDMYVKEAQTLIDHLMSTDPKERKADKMRKKILSLAHEMDWRIEGTKSIDMKRVNGWCVSYSYMKKPLDNYTYEELPKLVTQFEKVYKDYLSKL